MKKIIDALALAPDMRIDRVEALKRAIAAGQYEVSSHSLADKIIKNSIWEMVKIFK